MNFKFGHRLLFKNSMKSTFFDLTEACLADINSPAFEKSRSEGTDVPGMARYCLAMGTNILKLLLILLHHVRGLSVLVILC